MRYLFGPVNSRRLGISQGIDLLPGFCTFNCIYCEVNRQKIQTCKRREYTPTAAIIAEIDTLFAGQVNGSPAPDVYTITASGEPTLHTGIGRIIRHIKARTNKPVDVLTNGSLLHSAEVRDELMAADVVVPSLDSALPESFRRVNRPAPGLNLEKIITGIRQFKLEFPGEIWLEILLVKGVNDSEADIAALRETIKLISPHKTQLNTVDRPPFGIADPVPHQKLSIIARNLSGPVEIIASPAKRQTVTQQTIESSRIIELLRRRPCTCLDISQALRYDESLTETV
ncbi:MAG: radical SAM protein, partial [Deltaproteobacteria bacterium]|nr:radical SAM protein [Deltaproteobacteria bacterium]